MLGQFGDCLAFSIREYYYLLQFSEQHGGWHCQPFRIGGSATDFQPRESTKYPDDVGNLTQAAAYCTARKPGYWNGRTLVVSYMPQGASIQKVSSGSKGECPDSFSIIAAMADAWSATKRGS